MSELKAISGHEIREDIDYNTRGIDPENKEWRNYGKELCDTLYYRKSEADKLLAELKSEIERLEILCANYRHDCDNLAISNEQASRAARTLLKKMNYNKHKRCLAMAKWCRECSWSKCVEKVDFYYKWYNRWLELAEKFKPNNEVKNA